MKKDFTISEDWTGALYWGITLKWDYENRILDFSMPGYIKKVLQRYKHEKPRKLQHSPYPVAQMMYGKTAQDPIAEDTSRAASSNEIFPATKY